MKNIVDAIFVGSILLLLFILGIEYWLDKRLEKQGEELPDIVKTMITSVALFLLVCVFFSVSAMAAEWMDRNLSTPIPQTIVVKDHTGEVIAEYENDNDDLSYTYKNGKIEITSGEEQYIYLNVTVEIALRDRKSIWW